MMTWLEMVAHYKGYHNLLQEREEHRFPLLVRKLREPFYRHALRVLGQHLVHWGQKLQEQYPAPVSPSSWQVRQTG